MLVRVAKSSQLAFICLTLSAFCLTLLLAFVTRGMHWDGVLYAAMARNLSIGDGSIWAPHFIAQHFSTFYEHPSVGLWLESLFFRLFGDYQWVERLFCLMTALTTMLAMFLLWRRSFKTAQLRSVYWLPFFLFLSNLSFLRLFPYNFLDPILVCITVWAVWVLTTPNQRTSRVLFVQALAAALLIDFAFMVNGFQAFFVVAVPLARFIALRDIHFKQAIGQTLVIFVMMALGFIVLFHLEPAAWLNIKHYVQQQVLPSTIGARFEQKYTGFGRLRIMGYPFSENAIAIVLMLVFLFVGWLRHPSIDRVQQNRYAWFYVLIALCASAPVILAQRQGSSYVMQSMPFYLLALAQFITPGFMRLIEKLDAARPLVRTVLNSIGLLLVVFCVLWLSMSIGKVKRDQSIITAVNAMGHFTGKAVSIQTSPEDFIRLVKAQEYGYAMYFERLYRIELTTTKQAYYLSSNNPSTSHARFERVPLGLTKYHLYRRLN